MKEIIPHIKDIIIIIILAVISLVLGALFLKVESLKKEIPNQTHALLEVTLTEHKDRTDRIIKEGLDKYFENDEVTFTK